MRNAPMITGVIFSLRCLAGVGFGKSKKGGNQ
jgi:hypothetical protein